MSFLAKHSLSQNDININFLSLSIIRLRDLYHVVSGKPGHSLICDQAKTLDALITDKGVTIVTKMV